MSNFRVFCDGGSRGNPGPAAAGVVIYDGDKKLGQYNKYLGVQTNNYAEYSAVLLAFTQLETLKPTSIEFYLDSELVVKQLHGVYKIKNANIKPLFDQIKAHPLFDAAKFAHVYRADNKEADAQVNIALDQNSSK